MSTQIVEYSQTDAALADLTVRYKGVVYEVTTQAGMAAARFGRAELRDLRVSLEKKRVEIKAPALERCRLIDAEAKRITAELSGLEDPIDEQIRCEERKKEEARLAAERAEAERIAAEEAARKKAEEDRMAAERAEIASRQAELDRQEREARDRIEAEQREARRKIEDDDRAARAARQVEEDRLRKERETVEADARRVEEEKRKVREAEEARQREERRKKAEVLDAESMLKTFRSRFGHLPRFAPVVKAIDGVLAKVKA